MELKKNYKFWFATGSQDLYGDECLSHVAKHAQIIVQNFNESGILPFEVVWKPTLIDSTSIRRTFEEANADEECAGVITWMHTFSPAKSWIAGLQAFKKPLLHLHTQFNEEIPYDTIDMDFMNENQSAHGDREFGHIVTRMGIPREVVVGYYESKEVKEKIASWMRSAIGMVESKNIRVVRIADNMRNVAVTEGDKVEAQIKFGWEIDAYPVNEVVDYVNAVSKGDIDALTQLYYEKYNLLLEGRDPIEFKKPLLHLHTQFNEEIPYDTIDMDFMNENQSAHGDREFGHIVTRMGIPREVVVGYYESKEVKEKIASWMRSAVGMVESKNIRVVRIADNMRNVAVTEGDKVEAQIKFGWEIDAYPINEVVDYVNAVSKGDIDALTQLYYDKYDILLEGRDPKEFRRHVAVQAGIEIGLEKFLKDHDYQAVVTHFGDLGGLKQLPGLAIQRLMEKGYGFGAEGDWKTAAMVRLMKVMTEGKKDAKGTSFMEDYTYNFVPGKEGILEAHMLEVCPTIADGPVSIKVNPLSMGDREDPARLVFTAKEGEGIATSLIDLGHRFRLIINKVDCKKTEKPMSELPVATAFWTPKPDLYKGAEAWILAGGAHHTAFSYDLSVDQMVAWAEAMGIESVVIDENTDIRILKNELRWNEVVYR